MKAVHIKRLKIFFFLIVILQISFAQEPESKIKKKIVNQLETSVEKEGNRGLISKTGNVYFVEDDLQTVSAYKNQEKIWQKNILKELGKPNVGKPIIRYIKLNEEVLVVTFGKHNFAELDLKNGKIISSGSD